jgi:hypothetical protein
MVSKGPIFDREMALVLTTLSRPFDEDDDTLWRPTINDPLDKADSPVRHRQRMREQLAAVNCQAV